MLTLILVSIEKQVHEPLRVIIDATEITSRKLNESQMKYIKETSLYHFATMPSFDIGHAMITTLVERWRPKINTFHLGFGGVKLILKDVDYIYDLPINGEVVTNRTFLLTMRLHELFKELFDAVLIRKVTPTSKSILAGFTTSLPTQAVKR